MGAQKVGPDFSGERAKVYFTRHVDAGHLKQLYTLVNQRITGRIAVKLHTGAKNGLNILPHDMLQALLSIIPSSTIVEMNTLYPGDRNTTEKHLETLKVNGWTSVRSTSWTPKASLGSPSRTVGTSRPFRWPKISSTTTPCLF